MNSIAKNHLSQYGRFGDTEIAETSSGNLWHVNKYEKKLIDDYGNIGERIVDIVGSGTSNPTTGLKEQFAWMPVFAGAQLGVSMFQGAAAGSMQRDKASSQSRMAGLEISELNQSKKRLEERKNAQKQLAELETQKQFEDVTKSISDKSLEIEEGTKSAMQKSGLKSSAGIKKQQVKTEDSLLNAVEQTSESVTSQYGKTIGGIEGDYEADKARIRNEKNRAMIQQQMYDEQSEKKGVMQTLMGW